MSLAGTLESTYIGNLLQLLASEKKSGRLVLTHYSGMGLIVLRRGRIIYAASNAAREALGHLLLCKGLVSEDELRRCLELQHHSEKEQRLGTILVETGLLTDATLRRVITEQVQKVVSELLSWKKGFFRFEEEELPDRGEIEVDASDFLLDAGFSNGTVLEDLELGSGEATAASTPEGPDAPEPGRDRESDMKAPLWDSGRLGDLKTIMTSLHSPLFLGEITLEILNFARKLVRRGVLFSTGRLGFSGLGQFGVEPPAGGSPDFIRAVSLPPGEASILTEVMARKSVYRGPLEDSPVNLRLIESLGGEWPREVAAAPLLVSGRVLLVFYGDNVPGGEAIGDVDELEVVMLHAGIVMEKNLLAKRIEYLEALRRRGGGRGQDGDASSGR